MELGLVGGVDSGDGGVLRFGEGDDLREAGVFPQGTEEVVTYEEKKGVFVDEVGGEGDGVTVTLRLGLLDEGEAFGMGAGGVLITFGFARRDDDGCGIEAGGKDFGEKDL